MKRIFLTFVLDAPLGTRDPELTGLIDKGLEPLLALIERTPRLRAQIAIGGIVFDYLFEQRAKLLPRLAKFFRDGALMPLLSAHYDPELSLATSSELEMQLRLSRAAWERLPAPPPRGAWLPHGVNTELRAAIRALDCPLIVTPLESLTLARELGEKHALTQLHRAPDDLLLLPVSVIHSTLGGAVRAREVTSFFEETGSAGASILAPQIKLDPDILKNENAEPTHRSLERMFLRAGDDPQLTFETTAELLQPYFPLSASASTLPMLEESAFLPIPALHGKLESPRERRLLFYRLVQLATEMNSVPKFMAENANEFANNERYSKALAWFARAHSRELFAEEGAQTISHFTLRKQIYRAILSAQVEIDAIHNPEVDPSIGWARYEANDYDHDGEQEAIIDTQLVRLHFKPSQGANLVAFDYKPRKSNLVNHYDPQQAAECCTFALTPLNVEQASPESLRALLPLLPRSHGTSTVTLTRKTLDLIGLRFATPTTAIDPATPEKRGYSAELVNHVLMKSEIGAHLSNATTGFSMEYWLEGDSAPPDGLFLIQQWSMMLTSGDNRVLSVRPLLSAAGTHDRALNCDADLIVRPADAPGGLHGIRLIDGLDNFVIDLRSAKPVSAVAVLNIPGGSHGEGDPDYGGTTVLFLYEARRFFRDDRANTLFLSIK